MTDLSEYTLSQRKEAINEVIPSKRDREILCMRYLDGHSYKEIAEIKHLSIKRVGTILRLGSAKMGAYLLKKDL